MTICGFNVDPRVSENVDLLLGPMSGEQRSQGTPLIGIRVKAWQELPNSKNTGLSNIGNFGNKRETQIAISRASSHFRFVV